MDFCQQCSGGLYRCTHFSFTPPPTPAPLPWIVNVASSKVHELAAYAASASDNASTAMLFNSFIVRLFWASNAAHGLLLWLPAKSYVSRMWTNCPNGLAFSVPSSPALRGDQKGPGNQILSGFRDLGGSRRQCSAKVVDGAARTQAR